MRCTKCGSPNLHRSRTRSRGERRLRFFLPVFFYRCHQCNYRTMRATPRALAGAVGRYLVLGLLAWLGWRGFYTLFVFLVRT